MAAKPTYYELLKRPEWQRKRLEVLNRENFTCQWCESTDTTLHVHHTYYEKGKKPWEYPDHSLLVLCEECHESVGLRKARLDAFVAQLQRAGSDVLDRLIGYAACLATAAEVETNPQASYMEAYSSGEIEGFADFFGIRAYATETAAMHWTGEVMAGDFHELRAIANQMRKAAGDGADQIN